MRASRTVAELERGPAGAAGPTRITLKEGDVHCTLWGANHQEVEAIVKEIARKVGLTCTKVIVNLEDHRD